MKMFAAAVLVIAGVCASGCYHATIETGLSPNGQTITQKWASCWIFGLVPPKTVEAGAKCSGGISKVETQQSFLNGLVGMLTFGIYTPMEIVVECAGGSGAEAVPPEAQEIIVSDAATSEEIQKAYSDAANLAFKSNKPVYVRFEETGAPSLGM
jgi:hypothetical protein